MYICYYYQENSCTGPWIHNLMSKTHQNSMFFDRMVLEWRELEHDEVDKEFHRYINAQQALKRCGLYNFWKLGGLRAQPRLLQMFVDYWDPDTKDFQLDGMPPKTRSGRYLFHYRTITLRRGSKLMGSCGGKRAHHWGVYHCLLPFEYLEYRKLGSNEFHPEP